MNTVLIILPDPLLREAISLTLMGRYNLVSFRSIRDVMSAILSPVDAVVLGSVSSHAELLKLRLRFGLTPFVLLPGLEQYKQSRLEHLLCSPLSREGLIDKIESLLDRNSSICIDQPIPHAQQPCCLLIEFTASH